MLSRHLGTILKLTFGLVLGLTLFVGDFLIQKTTKEEPYSLAAHVTSFPARLGLAEGGEEEKQAAAEPPAVRKGATAGGAMTCAIVNGSKRCSFSD